MGCAQLWMARTPKENESEDEKEMRQALHSAKAVEYHAECHANLLRIAPKNPMIPALEQQLGEAYFFQKKYAEAKKLLLSAKEKAQKLKQEGVPKSCDALLELIEKADPLATDDGILFVS